MEEKEFKRTHAEFNPTPCYFAKAILCQCCGCTCSQKINIAERESIACTNEQAHQRCGEWLDSLYQNARFVLKLPNVDAPMPHAKAMKIQCGSPRGLLAALEGEAFVETHKVEDIHAVLEQSIVKYGNLQDLPYSQIVRFINQHSLKKRSRRNKSSKCKK